MTCEVSNECHIKVSWQTANPAGVYLLKVNNKHTRTRYKICSKLTIKTTE